MDAVATSVAEFGGLDILVNNASAISLTGKFFRWNLKAKKL